MNIFISACHGHCRAKNHYLPLSNLSSQRSHLKRVAGSVSLQLLEISFEVAQEGSQGMLVFADPNSRDERNSHKSGTCDDSMSGVRYSALKSGSWIKI